MSANAIRSVLTPVLPGWRIQFGRFDGDDAAARYVVIRPAGGARAELLRRPEFSVSLIGAEGDPIDSIAAAANAAVEALRDNAGGAIFLQPGEPAFVPSADRRPIFDLAVSAINA